MFLSLFFCHLTHSDIQPSLVFHTAHFTLLCNCCVVLFTLTLSVLRPRLVWLGWLGVVLCTKGCGFDCWSGCIWEATSRRLSLPLALFLFFLPQPFPLSLKAMKKVMSPDEDFFLSFLEGHLVKEPLLWCSCDTVFCLPVDDMMMEQYSS